MCGRFLGLKPQAESFYPFGISPERLFGIADFLRHCLGYLDWLLYPTSVFFDQLD